MRRFFNRHLRMPDAPVGACRATLLLGVVDAAMMGQNADGGGITEVGRRIYRRHS
ncbi:hypothetical protein KCP73_02895 [Salmonella enterica subsp. enterica]|nr:hypothetical protein KCP73_02895 [Salmonella enterica subsp. enterica]